MGSAGLRGTPAPELGRLIQPMPHQITTDVFSFKHVQYIIFTPFHVFSHALWLSPGITSDWKEIVSLANIELLI